MAKKIIASKGAAAKAKSASSASTSWTVIDDSRFADVQFDPRFMRPSKKTTKVKVDARFQAMLDPKNNDFDFQRTVFSDFLWFTVLMFTDISQM